MTRIERHCLEAKILKGESNGELKIIPWIKLTTSEGDLLFIPARKQFPIRFCFSMTVNKTPDPSIKAVGIDLCTSTFTHGQLYVSFSRITDVKKLFVLFRKDGDQKTDNIAYPEVLL